MLSPTTNVRYYNVINCSWCFETCVRHVYLEQLHLSQTGVGQTCVAHAPFEQLFCKMLNVSWEKAH